MAEQVEVLAAKPDDLSSIPTTHRVEGETPLPPRPRHTCKHEYNKYTSFFLNVGCQCSPCTCSSGSQMWWMLAWANS